MRNKTAAVLGAAFLMATSAIGPGFITQTTVFTSQLLTSFGFVILISIFMDIAAQLNIWRIVAVSGKRAQEISNDQIPGMGYVLAALIVFGGLAFNIGNVAGAGLGINLIFPIDSVGQDPLWGSIWSALIALAIFWFKEAGLAMDWFSKIMGAVMILLTLGIAVMSHPPLIETVKHSFFPETISYTAIITIVGGTVGGYISFAGAHRLLDAGITGKENLNHVSRGSIQAILLASLMRILLFLAALGVVYAGVQLDPKNPAASVFQAVAGPIGVKIFGVVLWSAAITSVIGSAYTSVSFVRSFHPLLAKYEKLLISFFIVFSTGIFIVIGKPIAVLILAGALNGLILPVALSMMLMATFKKGYLKDYKHPIIWSLLGWALVLVMFYMGVQVLMSDLPKIWQA